MTSTLHAGNSAAVGVVIVTASCLGGYPIMTCGVTVGLAGWADATLPQAMRQPTASRAPRRKFPIPDSFRAQVERTVLRVFSARSAAQVDGFPAARPVPSARPADSRTTLSPPLP